MRRRGSVGDEWVYTLSRRKPKMEIPDDLVSLTRVKLSNTQFDTEEAKVKTSIGIALVCFLSCSVVWGQAISNARISGMVQDPSGSVVPGAEVRVTQTDTNAVRTAVSGDDGRYVLTNLPVGP